MHFTSIALRSPLEVVARWSVMIAMHLLVEGVGSCQGLVHNVAPLRFRITTGQRVHGALLCSLALVPLRLGESGITTREAWLPVKLLDPAWATSPRAVGIAELISWSAEGGVCIVGLSLTGAISTSPRFSVGSTITPKATVTRLGQAWSLGRGCRLYQATIASSNFYTFAL